MSVIISEVTKFEKLKNKFIQAGANRLYILTDFDNTLTRAFVAGEKTISLIANLRDGNYLNADYALKANKLYNKYSTLLKDKNNSISQKKRIAQEWWKVHYRLLKNSGLKEKDIKQVIKKAKNKLRWGAKEFINQLNKKNIPLIILSANGLGEESIRLFLKKEGVWNNKIKIISNRLKWNKQGRFIGTEKPIIHSWNKNQFILKKFPDIYQLIKKRDKVMILGDARGDSKMAKVVKIDNLIKIGFLNEAVKNNLTDYRRVFDVVITNDGSMRAINNFLKKIN